MRARSIKIVTNIIECVISQCKKAYNIVAKSM